LHITAIGAPIPKRMEKRPIRKSARPTPGEHRASLLAEKLLDSDAKQVTEKCLALAKEGNPTALRLVMERLLPAVRDRRVSGFKLPPLNSAADAAEAMSAVLQAMASGALTPSEGESLSQTITAFLRVFEVVDIEARLTALEKREQIEENLRQGGDR
jgi:hypothetical protein